MHETEGASEVTEGATGKGGIVVEADRDLFSAGVDTDFLSSHKNL